MAAAIEPLEQGRQFAPGYQQRRQSAWELGAGDGESVTADRRLTPDL